MEFIATPTRSAEVLPGGQYIGKALSITSEMFTPKPDLLRDGENGDPYQRWLIDFTVKNVLSRAVSPYLMRVKNLPCGPNGTKAKFLAAVGKERFTEDDVVGRYFVLTIEDTLPNSTTECNWVRNITPYEAPPKAGAKAFVAVPDAPSSVEDDDLFPVDEDDGSVPF